MYMNINGVIIDLIDKDIFNKLLKSKNINSNKIRKLLNINKEIYENLLESKSDFSDVDVIKIEKLLHTKIRKEFKRY